MKPIISNNWRHKIIIKEHFSEETSPELIVKLCELLIKQIDGIIFSEDHGNLNDDNKYESISLLEDLKSNLEFLKDLANGTIAESNWGDYEFAGDFENWFNGYMEELYNIGDNRVLRKDNVLEKFIWIN